MYYDSFNYFRKFVFDINLEPIEIKASINYLFDFLFFHHKIDNKMKYDVFGIGNPLIDVIIKTEDSMLDELGISKGSMNLVDVDRQKFILEKHKTLSRFTALGGSCPNTMVMISQLGGKSALCGKIGLDELGDDYLKQLQISGVDSYLKRKDGMTGSTIILISPDADRTMNTHLGMCQHLAKDDLKLDAISNSKYLYVTGYQWDTPSQKETVLTALEHAKKNEITISLSLSDLFCVEKHKKDFQKLLDNYVNLVFCNELEAKQMTDEENPKDQLRKLSESVDHVVITLGNEGSLIKYNNDIIEVDAFQVEAIDTTGAGDAFAAGYLYALTQNYTIQQVGQLASICAAKVVSIDGPRCKNNFKEQVKDYIVTSN